MGRFIVFEGLDGAGTTTQAALLVEKLQAAGETVLATREPTDLPVGRLIRAALRGEADAVARSTLPWMFAADRADHLARTVGPGLERGWVVSDRYAPSSLAYQSLDVPLDLVWGLNQGFRAPDLTIFLKISAPVALARVVSRAGQREIFEEEETLRRVAHQYAVVFDRLRARGDRIVVIDGAQGIDAVEAAVWTAVTGLSPSLPPSRG